MNTIYDNGQHAALVSRLGRVRADTPGLWGRMDAPGMVCHLNDVFLTMFGERPSVVRPTLLLRTVVRFVAITVPMTWPKGAKTAPEFDQERGGTRPADFASDVAELKVNMRRFAETDHRTLSPHPAFGRLTGGEWGRWAWRHVDHHLRQFGL